MKSLTKYANSPISRLCPYLPFPRAAAVDRYATAVSQPSSTCALGTAEQQPGRGLGGPRRRRRDANHQAAEASPWVARVHRVVFCRLVPEVCKIGSSSPRRRRCHRRRQPASVTPQNHEHSVSEHPLFVGRFNTCPRTDLRDHFRRVGAQVTNYTQHS